MNDAPAPTTRTRRTRGVRPVGVTGVIDSIRLACHDGTVPIDERNDR